MQLFSLNEFKNQLFEKNFEYFLYFDKKNKKNFLATDEKYSRDIILSQVGDKIVPFTINYQGKKHTIDLSKIISDSDKVDIINLGSKKVSDYEKDLNLQKRFDIWKEDENGKTKRVNRTLERYIVELLEEGIFSITELELEKVYEGVDLKTPDPIKNFNFNPIVTKLLKDYLKLDADYDFVWKNAKKTFTFKGVDAKKSIYQFVADDGEMAYFDDNEMFNKIKTNSLIPKVEGESKSKFNDLNESLLTILGVEDTSILSKEDLDEINSMKFSEIEDTLYVDNKYDTSLSADEITEALAKIGDFIHTGSIFAIASITKINLTKLKEISKHKIEILHKDSFIDLDLSNKHKINTETISTDPEKTEHTKELMSHLEGSEFINEDAILFLELSDDQNESLVNFLNLNKLTLEVIK